MEVKKMGAAQTAGAVYCLSSVITKAVTLISTPIFTRLMDGVEYGKYILYISLYGITAAAASVGASSGVIYNVFAEREDKIREISFSGFLTSLPISAVICILLFAFSGVLQLDPGMIPYLFVHTILDVLISSYLLKFRYTHKAWRIFAVEIAKAVISVALSYYLVAVLGLRVMGRIIGFVLTLIPFAVISLVSFGRGAFAVPRSIMARVEANAMPASISALFLALGVYFVNIVISVTLGKESLAIFSIFNTIATAPVFLITAIIAAIAPSVQSEIRTGSDVGIRQMYKTSSSLISAIIMIIFLISKEALSILAPRSYNASIFIILPLLLYSQLKLADQFLSCVLNAKRIYRYSLFSNIIFSLSTLAILLLLLNLVGLFAAGLAMLIGVILSVTQKMLHIRADNISAVSPADIALPFISVFAFGALALMLADMPALRVLLAIYPAVRLMNLYFGSNFSLKPEKA